MSKAGATTRRRVLAGAAAALAAPSVSARAEARVLRFVPHDDLGWFDPTFWPFMETRNHALMVYDTLFSLDSKLAKLDLAARDFNAGDLSSIHQQLNCAMGLSCQFKEFTRKADRFLRGEDVVKRTGGVRERIRARHLVVPYLDFPALLGGLDALGALPAQFNQLGQADGDLGVAECGIACRFRTA